MLVLGCKLCVCVHVYTPTHMVYMCVRVCVWYESRMHVCKYAQCMVQVRVCVYMMHRHTYTCVCVCVRVCARAWMCVWYGLRMHVQA